MRRNSQSLMAAVIIGRCVVWKQNQISRTSWSPLRYEIMYLTFQKRFIKSSLSINWQKLPLWDSASAQKFWSRRKARPIPIPFWLHNSTSSNSTSAKWLPQGNVRHGKIFTSGFQLSTIRISEMLFITFTLDCTNFTLSIASFNWTSWKNLGFSPIRHLKIKKKTLLTPHNLLV